MDSSTLLTLLLCGLLPTMRLAAYMDGPKVSDNAADMCSYWYGTLDEAGAKCSSRTTCNVLHDYQCDGKNWRYCDKNISAVKSAGTDEHACIRIKATAAWADFGEGCCSGSRST